VARARSCALCAAALVDVVAGRASTLQLRVIVMQVLDPILAINLPPDPAPPRLPDHWPEPPPLPVEPPLEPIEPPTHDPEPPPPIEPPLPSPEFESPDLRASSWRRHVAMT